MTDAPQPVGFTDAPPPVRLHHIASGPEGAPVVLLGPSLGTTLEMWDDLVAALAGEFRVVAFDTRGHGGSPVPRGPYSVEELVADVVALADELGIARFAYVGLSLGGAIGQVLAASHAERVQALVLCCTGPHFGDPATWLDRAGRVRTAGMAWLVGPTTERWFTPDFVGRRPDRARRLLSMIAGMEPEGYAACCEALADFDATARLGAIAAPTRVIAGADDPVCPPSTGRILADGIPDAHLVVIDDAAHIANVAQPRRFNTAVLEHLRRHR